MKLCSYTLCMYLYQYPSLQYMDISAATHCLHKKHLITSKKYRIYLRIWYHRTLFAVNKVFLLCIVSNCIFIVFFFFTYPFLLSSLSSFSTFVPTFRFGACIPLSSLLFRRRFPCGKLPATTVNWSIFFIFINSHDFYALFFNKSTMTKSNITSNLICLQPPETPKKKNRGKVAVQTFPLFFFTALPVTRYARYSICPCSSKWRTSLILFCPSTNTTVGVYVTASSSCIQA